MTAIASLSVSAVLQTRRKLSTIEKAHFKDLEKRAIEHVSSFKKFCLILIEVRDKKLYEEGWGSFAEYLEDRWELTTNSACRKMAHYGTVQAIEGPDPDITKVLPQAEYQTRPLHKLNDEDKVEAWEKAVEIAGGKQPKLADVTEAARQVAPELYKPRKVQPKTVDDVELAKAAGIIPEGATVEVSRAEIEPERVRADTLKVQEADLTDSEWLAREEITSITSKLSERIRKRFEAEAIAFRQATPGRLELIRTVKPVLDRVKRENCGYIGPWMYYWYAFAKVNGPERWVACDACKGTGQMTLIGECSNCKGRGYYV